MRTNRTQLFLTPKPATPIPILGLDVQRSLMAMSSTSENGPNALFHYNPNLTGAILFIALFTITTLIHAFQLFRTRTWYLIPLIIGGLCIPPSPSQIHALYLLTDVNSQSRLLATSAVSSRILKRQTGPLESSSCNPSQSSLRQRSSPQVYTWAWDVSSAHRSARRYAWSVSTG